MKERNKAILEGAVLIARNSGADAVILAASLPEEARFLEDALPPKCRVISTGLYHGPEEDGRDGAMVVLPEVRLRRRGRAKVALLEGLAAGLIHAGERVIVVSGDSLNGGFQLDTVAFIELDRMDDLLGGESDAPLSMLAPAADPAAFDALLGLCVALGHEGKEGKPVGLLATLGDHDAVLERSHPLVLNPFEGHRAGDRSILKPAAQRAVREFSGMDGAFVFGSDGVVVAAGRYLQDLAPEHTVPSGLGTRHRAAAGITATTGCIAFVVSESTGDTRVFAGGRLLMTIERSD